MHSTWQVKIDDELIFDSIDKAAAYGVYEDYAELVDTPSSDFTKSRVALLCGDVEVEAHVSGDQTCSPVIY